MIRCMKLSQYRELAEQQADEEAAAKKPKPPIRKPSPADLERIQAG